MVVPCLFNARNIFDDEWQHDNILRIKTTIIDQNANRYKVG